MIRFACDENFNHDIVRGLQARIPSVDILTVQQVNLGGAPDETVLTWAATADRVLLTHDQSTMVGFAYGRMWAALPMPGVILVPNALAIGRAVEDLEVMTLTLTEAELADRVWFLPL